MQALIETLLNKFPDTVLSVDEDAARSETTVQIASSGILDVMRFLHDAPEASFDHITDICSADYPSDQQRFEVIYQLLSIPRGKRIRLKTRLTEENPSLDSVTSIWRGADFLEREVYDMMGIRFTGHPDLRRILLPEDYAEGYPLRKDFPAEGRGWRSQFDFIPRLDEPPMEQVDSEVSEAERKVFLPVPSDALARTVLDEARRRFDPLLIVAVQASAGTLQGFDGIQDATLSVKWRGLNQKFGDRSHSSRCACAGP